MTRSLSCKSSADFDTEFASELGHKRLEDMFKEFKDDIIKKSFAYVKSIPWFVKGGEQIRVAVKQVRLFNAVLVEQTYNEIEKLNQLQGNQHVLKMYGCMETIKKVKQLNLLKNESAAEFIDRKFVYIVLEKFLGDFEDNDDIQSPFMKFKILPLIKKLELSLQLAEGLKSLHDTGLVHGNLTPTNLMTVDKNLSKLKINNLGWCAKIGSHFQPSTRLYLDIDALHTGLLQTSFDTHSFGLTIAGMEFGSNSFKGTSLIFFDTDKSLFAKERKENVEKLLSKATEWKKQEDSIIDDSFTQILMNCIDLDASKRPSDEDLIKRLKDVIEEAKRIAVVREKKLTVQLVNTPMVDIQIRIAGPVSAITSKRVADNGKDDNNGSSLIYVLIGVILIGLLVPLGYFLCIKRQSGLVSTA